MKPSSLLAQDPKKALPEQFMNQKKIGERMCQMRHPRNSFINVLALQVDALLLFDMSTSTLERNWWS